MSSRTYVNNAHWENQRKSIVSRPIKFRSLYEALVPDSQDLKPVVKKPKPNKELSKVARSSFPRSQAKTMKAMPT